MKIILNAYSSRSCHINTMFQNGAIFSLHFFILISDLFDITRYHQDMYADCTTIFKYFISTFDQIKMAADLENDIQ